MIDYHPRKGTILICDFSLFEAPEMVKRRPVVVITPELPGRQNLCTVVPLSTTKRNPMQPYHHKMSIDSLNPWAKKSACWAVCDMIYTVGFHRLDRIEYKQADGKWIYGEGKVTIADMEGIELAVLNGLVLQKFLKSEA